jgi:hypothetical protein
MFRSYATISHWHPPRRPLAPRLELLGITYVVVPWLAQRAMKLIQRQRENRILPSTGALVTLVRGDLFIGDLHTVLAH